MDNIERICRLCSKIKSNYMKNLFSEKYSNYLNKVKKITGFEFKNESHLPQFICRQCRDDLREASAFRSRCIRAQYYFTTEEYMLTVQFINQIKKIKVSVEEKQQADAVALPIGDDAVAPIEEDATEDQQETIEILAAECDDDYDIIEEEFLKDECEYLEITDKKEEILNNTTTEEYIRIDSDDVIYDEVNFEIVPCALDSEQKVNCNAADKDEKQSKNVKKAAENEPVKKRIRKNAKPPRHLVCDQCGSVFRNNNHFETHLNKHSGFRPYECEFCPSKFFTKTELKGHRRIHTGERPYGCKYCGRRFLNSSKRGSHEKTHSGERPYKCKNCEKRFISNKHLKHHMVVHSNERRFSCPICNKFYKRRTELRNHKRSKEHTLKEKILQNSTENKLQTENL